MRVAFQGEPGAYSHEAALAYAKGECEVVPCRAFRDAFRAVADGSADVGILPIENSLTGSVHEVYDLLLEYPLEIVGEVFRPVAHRLLGVPGARLEDVKAVYSHPQALGQCTRFLEELGAEQHAFYDTAGAAKWVAERGDPTQAALAGPLAARLYGLEVLRENIADSEHNTTRFLALVLPGGLAPPEGAFHLHTQWRTSLVVELRHEPGALYRALGIFAERGINLTKLESRPLRTERWWYRFYLDFEGHRGEPRVREALERLEQQAIFLRVLGSYPQGDLQSPPLPDP